MKLTTRLKLSLGALALVAAVPMAAVQAQTRGGTLSMIVQPEPPILIPALNQQAPTQFVAGKIYESLLTYSFDLKPQPGLAKSWEVSPDGLAYTFHLQQGVQWHDGKPFTADDVVFSMTELLPKTHARARVILGRYLEHSRIFSFGGAGDPQVYIGSADMMHRNLDRRIEALVRVTSPTQIKALEDLFTLAMSEGTSSWHLQADGDWVRHSVNENGKRLVDLQDKTMTNVQRRRRARAVR